MEKLYSLAVTKENDKKDLYVKGEYEYNSDKIKLIKNKSADFTTYFNSFSVKKWKRYTTIDTLKLELDVEGKIEIQFKEIASSGERIIHTEMLETGLYSHIFSVNDLSESILGFELRALEEGSSIKNGAYYGAFQSWNSQKIGIAVCTFKREVYIEKILSLIEPFAADHPWLSTLIVDNGNTLTERNDHSIRIVHNPNYGGGGGFARGIIETVEKGTNDYVLLMDDDINLEMSSIERTHSLLSGLRMDYKKSFLSGAMLSMEHPTTQAESTAFLNKIKLQPLGRNMDMTDGRELFANEMIRECENHFCAWFYCCIPVARIKEIGYTLPMFLCGGDVEYGIRNRQEIINMNGICVWHLSAMAKAGNIVTYYSDRGSMILNNYADGCGILTFSVIVFGKLFKRMLRFDLRRLNILDLVLVDYCSGYEGITAIRADEKHKQINQFISQSVNWTIIPKVLYHALFSVLNYSNIHNGYVAFRKEQFQDSQFWKRYFEL